jgi:hypothetical protein
MKKPVEPFAQFIPDVIPQSFCLSQMHYCCQSKSCFCNEVVNQIDPKIIGKLVDFISFESVHLYGNKNAADDEEQQKNAGTEAVQCL